MTDDPLVDRLREAIARKSETPPGNASRLWSAGVSLTARAAYC
jgi:hypothetical protein